MTQHHSDDGPVLDVNDLRPVDAFARARTATEHMHALDFEAAYQVMGLPIGWLDDSTLLEAVRIATARVNELLARAGLPPAPMPPDLED